MAKKSLRHTLKRIDVDLAKEIEEHAKKNRLSLREASRDIAKIVKKMKSNKNKTDGGFKI